MFKNCANIGCTANGTKTCALCQQSSYCSKLCQKQNWRKHKYDCQPPWESDDPEKDQKRIRCVKLYGQSTGGSAYEDIHLPSSHPVFENDPVPISLKIGYPLVIERIEPYKYLPRNPETDNQHATWLMIDPVTGFAPGTWRGGIGSVYVASPDQKPLTQAILAAIVDYVSDILDAFGGVNPGPNVQSHYDKARLEQYLVQHQEMQIDHPDNLEEWNKLLASGPLHMIQ